MAADLDGLLLEFHRRVQESNHVAQAIGDGTLLIFREVPRSTPKLVPAELGFLRCVSLFYVYFFEAGREGVAFLVDKLNRLGLDPTGVQASFLECIQQLRTFLQHNLYPDSEHDVEIQRSCERWFKNACGTAVPDTEEHWIACLTALLLASGNFVGSLKDVVRRIEVDESVHELVAEWRFRRDRYKSPHEFDELIAETCADMGLALDAARVRKRFFDRWSKQIALLSGDCDPEMEARKIVERTLLSEAEGVLPITGADVIEMLGIEPGPTVGKVLRRARELHGASYLGRDTLLAQLKAEFRGVGST